MPCLRWTTIRFSRRAAEIIRWLAKFSIVSCFRNADKQVNFDTLQSQIASIAEEFRRDRPTRQLRRQLDRSDFAKLHEAGFTLVGLPRGHGGLWDSVSESTRAICETLRILSRGDASVALVSAMHPAVLSYWLTAPASLSKQPDWDVQCEHIFSSVRRGEWWGTITSEPGSGGDITRTKTFAVQAAEAPQYLLTGTKHFGSGSGIVSYMVTTAVPEDGTGPEWFFVDMRNHRWDGSTGVSLISEWDGHGMIATQSNSFSFENFPATRMAWPDSLLTVASNAVGFIGCLFTSVIIGILDEATATAGAELAKRELGAYEQTEWTRARLETWLARQAFAGMLNAVESGDDVRCDILMGKTAIAELSESILNRLCHILGGTTLGRRSPFGFWLNDVRALGQLRPPWPLAYRTLAAAG